MINILLTVTAAPGAPRVPLSVDPDITPTQLRQEAASATKIPPGTLKLIVRGRLVTDNDTLSAVAEYKLEEGSVLHCMGRPVEVSSTGSTETLNAASIGTLPTVSVQPSVSASTVSASAGTSASDPLQAALTVLRTSNPPTVYQTAIATLDKILSNVIENPMEEKYRSLKVQNAAFQRRLGGLQGGNAAILACGFNIETIDGEEKYVMAASADKWNALLATKATVAQALVQANRSNNEPVADNVRASVTSPILPGLSMNLEADLRSIPPEMRQAAAEFLSHPERIQALLQDPHFQTVLRNDPRYRSDPMMARALDEMISNPMIATAAAQAGAMNPQSILQNPAQMQQLMQMARSLQQNGGIPAMNPNNAAGAPNNLSGPAGGGTGGNSNSNDADQTEEEMIAEAIRRSLQDDNGS